MPWVADDAQKFKKGVTGKQAEAWASIANEALSACLADGGTEDECAASAIKQANGVVEAERHDHESLGERILEAVFTEHATVKATVQGFLRAAHAVAKHPNVPAKIKKQVEELRSQLAAHTWADLATDSGGTQTATEASKGIREALQSIARKQVRSRLREMSLGGVSVAEFETKLQDALAAKLGDNYEFRILDIYETMVIFAAEGGMWGAPYTISLDGSLSIGKPVRVKRICRYIPDDETIEQEPIGDREDQGGELPDDWWKYSQDWGDGFKVLGSTPTDTGRGPSQEALREQGSIVAEFVEDGALIEAGDSDV